MEQQVTVSRSGAVGTIALNRPGALNALSAQMTDELIAAGAELERDSSIRCVVVCGEGPHFSVGGDVKNFREQMTTNREATVAGREALVLRTHQFI